MKKVLILAAAALALAACAKQQEIPVEETQPMAVGFDGYLNRGVTKAVTDLDALKGTTSDPGPGFGIFAYYTDNEDYVGSSIPNYMYNQQVTWDASAWTYSPVKYWPNEYGDKAISEDSDRISFFAYAPYAAADLTTGKTGKKTGIIGFTRNNYAGDPLVKYVVDLDPSKSVDLIWGRQPGNSSFVSYDGKTYATPALEGLPWLNVRRPQQGTKETVKFWFDHALASLNVTVDAYVDGITNANERDALTRIWIRSITFTGFATEGTLNLNNIEKKSNNGVALWQSINGDDLVTGEEVTIFDGRKDGREGTTAASNEKVLGLNEALIQAETYIAVETPSLSLTTTKTGVTKTAQNLFKPETGTDDPIYVIPTGDKVTVTIAYDVETYDPSLSTFLSDGVTHGSSISNVITKAVGTDLVLENGKKYIIKLHLGMDSVKVDAGVTAWVNGAEEDVDLPSNHD